MRLAALMRQRVIHVLTHDSIGLGEDGPTHQPVEHLASLRAMPRLLVFRPADAVETAECWQLALQQENRPSVLALTRQKVPPVRTTPEKSNLCALGAYELVGADDGQADAVIFATGSEVHLALKAREMIEAEGFAVRVVSVPCMELFDEQDDEHKRRIIGTETVRAVIEAGVRDGWWRFISRTDIFIGMEDFGKSGPGEELFRHFGITAERLAEAVLARLKNEPAADEGDGEQP